MTTTTNTTAAVATICTETPSIWNGYKAHHDGWALVPAAMVVADGGCTSGGVDGIPDDALDAVYAGDFLALLTDDTPECYADGAPVVY